MDYITIKEASQKWNLSTRRILSYCTEGRIPGAQKHGRLWLIPASANKPADGRTIKRPLAEPAVLLGNATYAEYHSDKDLCSYDLAICKGLNLFLQGDFELSLRTYKSMIRGCTDKNYLLVAYGLAHYAAILNGDLQYKEYSLKKIKKLYKDPVVNELTKLMVSSRLHAWKEPMPFLHQTNPDILNELLPCIALESLRHFLTFSLKSSHFDSLASQEILCDVLKNKNCPQIYVYYNIILAVYYTIIGYEQYAKAHLERAAEVALPRGWYTPFAEYALTVDLSFIEEIDPQAFSKIQSLSMSVNLARAKINPAAFADNSLGSITIRDFQVAYQMACGKSNAEITQHLGMSAYAVKKAIAEIYAKSGFTSRTQVRENVMEYIFL